MAHVGGIKDLLSIVIGFCGAFNPSFPNLYDQAIRVEKHRLEEAFGAVIVNEAVSYIRSICFWGEGYR